MPSDKPRVTFDLINGFLVEYASEQYKMLADDEGCVRRFKNLQDAIEAAESIGGGHIHLLCGRGTSEWLRYCICGKRSFPLPGQAHCEYCGCQHEPR